jgi:hypothetical protein
MARRATTGRVSVHVAHAAFLPERQATLKRLLKQLKPQGVRPVVHRSEIREHSSVWATRVYEACAAENAEAAIVLNDDVEVSPRLIMAVEDLLELKTSRMVSLHAVHPMCRSLAEAGLTAFATYHLTGPGYVLRRGVARELLAYYAALPKAWKAKVNEDNVAIQYAFRLREPIWNTIPALVLHDASVPSSLGYEKHPQRVTPVAWTDPLFGPDRRRSVLRVSGEEQVPFLETHWTKHATLLATEIAISLGVDTTVCWFCLERPGNFASDKSGTRICGRCVHNIVGHTINQSTKEGTMDVQKRE